MHVSRHPPLPLVVQSRPPPRPVRPEARERTVVLWHTHLLQRPQHQWQVKRAVVKPVVVANHLTAVELPLLLRPMPRCAALVRRLRKSQPRRLHSFRSSLATTLPHHHLHHHRHRHRHRHLHPHLVLLRLLVRLLLLLLLLLLLHGLRRVRHRPVHLVAGYRAFRWAVGTVVPPISLAIAATSPAKQTSPPPRAPPQSTLTIPP
mmetsp:Transcript_17506/g.52375  ORF Transcript_17506/g.52375 Transcript_17506/m.52375 type:complete len:204 (-) Transcript_17506:2743-3354(-)